MIDIHALEVKRQIRRQEYAVDVDAVAEAIVRRMTARRVATPAADAQPNSVPPEEGKPAGLVS